MHLVKSLIEAIQTIIFYRVTNPMRKIINVLNILHIIQHRFLM